MTLPTRRLVATVSGGLLTAAVLAGCGDSDDSTSAGGDSSGGDYCAQVEEMKGNFQSFEDPDYSLGDVSDTVDLIGDITESAPDDVASSWDSLHSAMSDFESGLDDFGVDPDKPLQSELERVVTEEPERREEILATMSSMEDVQSDAEAIEKQVKAECDIDLNEGSGAAPDAEGDGS